MLDKTKFDKETVWKIVKETRKSFLSEHTDPECQNQDTLLCDDCIQNILENLTTRMKINATSKPNKNVSDRKMLKTSSEMFTFLNFCPPRRFHSLVRSILENSTPRDIIFGLTSIMKTTRYAEKQLSVNTLLKVMEVMKLDHYEQIQLITKRKCFHGDKFGNCTRNVTKKSINLGLTGNKIIHFIIS